MSQTIVFGKEFNEKYKDGKFYLPLHNDLTIDHSKHKYQLGENIDASAFGYVPVFQALAPGIRFYEETMLYDGARTIDLTKYGKLAFVKISDDAKVCDNKYWFETDKLIVVEIIDFNDMSNEFWLKIAEKDYKGLQYVKKPTNEICFSAIQKNYSALQYIKEQTDKMCIFAVQKNYNALQYVKEQTNEICIEAVKNNGCALQYVEKHLKTKEMCIEAVKNNGRALQHVEKHLQTEEMCFNAVAWCGKNLNYVDDQTEEICMTAIKRDSNNLQYIRDQTDEECLISVRDNGFTLRFVKKQTPEIVTEALKRHKNAKKYASKQILHSLIKINVRYLHTQIRGCEFNKYCGDLKLYTFFNDDNLSNHNNKKKYQLGLIYDDSPYDVVNYGSRSIKNYWFRRGIEFCEESAVHANYRAYTGKNKVALVRVPRNAKIYIENHSFKSDELEIIEICDCDKMSNDFWKIH